LQIDSMNEAIGRDRWHLTLTIANDSDRFVLVGFTMFAPTQSTRR